MALTLNISETDVGAEFDAAYARVAHAVVENNFDEAPVVMVVVEFYATERARINRALPVHRTNITIPLPEGDFMTGVYTSLKATNGFEGAEDC